jgi:hypothetical protein
MIDKVKRRARQYRWRDKNPDKVRAIQKRWFDKNPERARILKRAANRRWAKRHPEITAELKRRWVADNPEKVAAAKKRASEQSKLLRERLVGSPMPDECEICQRTNVTLAADHDHATGKYRGWLCHNCNLSLGNARDDSSLLRKMADWLDRFSGERK